MLTLYNGWTRQQVIDRIREVCGSLRVSPRLVVDSEGACCALGALLPEAARKLLAGRDCSGPDSFVPILSSRDQSWRKAVPFRIDGDPDNQWYLIERDWWSIVSSFDDPPAGVSPAEAAVAALLDMDVVETREPAP